MKKILIFTPSLCTLLLSLVLMNPVTTVQSTSHFDSDAWKNEGIFNPLVPFESYEWSEDIYTEFDEAFAQWSDHMDQSYYQINDVREVAEATQTFRGFEFEEIVKNAYVDGYKIGFTYQNRDYRSDFDSQRYDIFGMYGSDHPDQKHLYIFAVNTEDDQPIVYYLDGETVVEGEKFEMVETANEDLKAWYYKLMGMDLSAGS